MSVVGWSGTQGIGAYYSYKSCLATRAIITSIIVLDDSDQINDRDRHRPSLSRCSMVPCVRYVRHKLLGIRQFVTDVNIEGRKTRGDLKQKASPLSLKSWTRGVPFISDPTSGIDYDYYYLCSRFHSRCIAAMGCISRSIDYSDPLSSNVWKIEDIRGRKVQTGRSSPQIYPSLDSPRLLLALTIFR